MKKLLLTIVIATFCYPIAGPAKEAEHLQSILKIVSRDCGVPYNLLVAIMRVESRGNPSALVLNDGGSPSIGAFQLKMNTARAMGYRGTMANLMDFHTNATYGAKYLRYQLDRYQGNWLRAVCAYNQGTFEGHQCFGYTQKVLYALGNF